MGGYSEMGPVCPNEQWETPGARTWNLRLAEDARFPVGHQSRGSVLDPSFSQGKGQVKLAAVEERKYR